VSSQTECARRDVRICGPRSSIRAMNKNLFFGHSLKCPFELYTTSHFLTHKTYSGYYNLLPYNTTASPPWISSEARVGERAAGSASVGAPGGGGRQMFVHCGKGMRSAEGVRRVRSETYGS
jgi:hypothetical protein